MRLLSSTLLLVASCGWGNATAAYDGTGSAPVQQKVWIVGTADHADMTATIQSGRLQIYCNDRARWPAGVEGQKVAVVGILTYGVRISTPSGARSRRDAAMEGEKYVIGSCDLPPAETSGELIDAERAIPDDAEREELTAYRAGDSGIVRGVRVTRSSAGDAGVEERLAFIDVFVREGGAWRKTSSLSRPARR